MIEPPYGRVPEQVSKWDLMRIETCGGEKVFVVCPLVYGEYLGIYRANIGVKEASRGPQIWGGGAPLRHASRACRQLVAPLTPPEGSWVSSGPRKILKKFHSIWSPFGTDFL